MIIITAEPKAAGCSPQSLGWQKKKSPGRINGSIQCFSSLSMQPLLTLVSGCQQTVALTFLTNELFWFNDPFCWKNEKIAAIIAKGGEGESKWATHTPFTLFDHLMYTPRMNTCIPLIAPRPRVCLSKTRVKHPAWAWQMNWLQEKPGM